MALDPASSSLIDSSRDSPTMSPKAAARELSIPDLLSVLDEKLDEECSRPLSLVLSAALLESEVRCRCLPGGCGTRRPDTWSLDQDHGDSGARHPEVNRQSTEHVTERVATGKQVTP